MSHIECAENQASHPHDPAHTSQTTTLDMFAFRARLINLIHPRQPENELLNTVKTQLNELNNTLITAFTHNTDVETLLRYRANCIDSVLTLLWQTLVSHNLTAPAAFLAAGGYGRRELHLHSDIDLLFLFDNEFNLSNQRETIQHFVAFLWDTGLKVGHSVRTLEHSIEHARSDISIATNLMEARLLIGDAALFHQLRTLTSNDSILTDAYFFRAKQAEQLERHQKNGNTECSLEPNLKTAPGGLRDVQTIVWITRKHFGVRRLRELVQNQFLTQAEFKSLNDAQNVLWRFRYALHVLTGRDENRILFDYQKNLARMLGFNDPNANRAVEALMQLYYRSAMTISELNEQLMQHFQEEILSEDTPQKMTVLNDRFRIRNQLIEVIHDNIFKEFPSALLEIFVLLAQNKAIKGIRASTIRLIRSHGHLIDDAFRDNPQNRKWFMDLLRSPYRLFTQLRRMKRYGVLARYIPAFSNTVGQMQYDLFHVYTVDAHILYVVRNIRKFLLPEHLHAFPLASELALATPKKELLYLAALFHDIAKGRPGDHSTLGASDVVTFATNHGLPADEIKLVAWLVQHHLLMSSTAQKKDITDPDVVIEFAQKVGDLEYLNHLYILTVADINGTNPKLWNTWRDALLSRLYHETKRTFYRGLCNPIRQAEKIREHRQAALELTKQTGFDNRTVRTWWDTLPDEYFLRESPENIAWHTKVKFAHGNRSDPLIAVKEATPNSAEHHQRALQVFTYLSNRPNIFLATASTMEQMGLSIVDARLITTAQNFSVGTYLVIDPNQQNVPYSKSQLLTLKRALASCLAHLDHFHYLPSRRLPRELRHFDVATTVHISNEPNDKRTLIEVNSLDRPGLLAIIANQFRKFGLEINCAKIATLGERAEDIFCRHGPKRPPFTRHRLMP